jgi:glycosyltransferase involved in cell wall biosynthesis
MNKPPKILYLAPCAPMGKPYGLRLRTAAVARALQAMGNLDCVVVQVGGDGFTDDAAINAKFGFKRHIEPVPIGPRSLRNRLRCACDARYLEYFGHTVSEVDRAALEASFTDYDLIWVHHLHTANYLRRWKWTRTVMDLDDIPSTFYQTLLDQSRGLKERLQAQLKKWTAQRRERLLAERFPVLAVCSETDRQLLGFDENVHVIPNGFSRPDLEPVRQPTAPPRIGFIGKFGYRPNDDGIRWFLRECWPKIIQAIPDAEMRIVGEGGESVVPCGGSGIRALGWVDDAAAEIATWSVTVVPLQMGSGTRLKIAEAFSRKCPLVSTSLGAYGYQVQHGRELLLADAATDFAAACVKVIREPAFATAMAERAWSAFVSQWTWDAIQPRIHAAAEAALRLRDEKGNDL